MEEVELAVEPSEQAPSDSTCSKPTAPSAEVVSSAAEVDSEVSTVAIQPTQTYKQKKDTEQVHREAAVVPTSIFQPVVAPVELLAPENVTEEAVDEDETEVF